MENTYIMWVQASSYLLVLQDHFVLIAASQHMITLKVTAGAAHQIANFNCS
jgi:arginine repressor